MGSEPPKNRAGIAGSSRNVRFPSPTRGDAAGFCFFSSQLWQSGKLAPPGCSQGWLRFSPLPRPPEPDQAGFAILPFSRPPRPKSLQVQNRPVSLLSLFSHSQAQRRAMVMTFTSHSVSERENSSERQAARPRSAKVTDSRHCPCCVCQSVWRSRRVSSGPVCGPVLCLSVRLWPPTGRRRRSRRVSSGIPRARPCLERGRRHPAGSPASTRHPASSPVPRFPAIRPVPRRPPGGSGRRRRAGWQLSSRSRRGPFGPRRGNFRPRRGPFGA